MEQLVTDFEAIRVQHDHYRIKVEELEAKVRQDVCSVGVRGLRGDRG